MTYVVCQNGNCAQTYPMYFFEVITKDTKNISCDKCGGVLVDKDGRADLSANPDVLKFITEETLRKQDESELREKKKVLKKITDEIAELEERLNKY